MFQPIEATEAIKAWIEEHLAQQGFSMREASIKAGLSPGYISQILRGQPPGIEACLKLAKLFGSSGIYVLYLAGYLDRDPLRGVSPELQNILDMLESMRDEPLYNEVLRAIHAVIAIAGSKMDQAE